MAVWSVTSGRLHSVGFGTAAVAVSCRDDTDAINAVCVSLVQWLFFIKTSVMLYKIYIVCRKTCELIIPLVNTVYLYARAGKYAKTHYCDAKI